MQLKIETKALSESFMALGERVKKNGDGGGDFGALLKHAETKQSEAASELEKYLKMTPAERMAAAILKSMGITQAEFDAMPPEQKAAITEKIAAIMKQQMEDKMAENQQKTNVTAL
jgi:hypothetical protein